jgi:hypothetical protein
VNIQTPTHTAIARRLAQVLLLVSLALFEWAVGNLADASYHAQFVARPEGMAARPRAVMSGREFDAVMDSCGFDHAQRSSAGAAFDDTQARMFDAKRAFDLSAGVKSPSDQSIEAVSIRLNAKAALRATMLAEVDGLFASLAAIARPEQQAALKHEGRMARLRTVRATMLGSTFSDLGVRTVERDVASTLESAQLDDASVARARTALDPSLGRLEEALVRLGDARAERDRVQAEARGNRAAAGKVPSSRAAVMEAAGPVAAAHREGLAALDRVLSGPSLHEAKSNAARVLWPPTADPRSPQRTLEKMLARETAAERRAAIESVRDAWWAAWWPATLRMTESLGPGAAKVAPELADARMAANRQAWETIAGLDPANRDSHLASARPRRDGRINAPDAQPQKPEVATDVPAVDESDVAAKGPPGMPGGDAPTQLAPGAAAAGLAGARMPQPMREEEIRALPRALGIDVDPGVVTQVARDYLDRVAAAEADLGVRVRSKLAGVAVRWMIDGDPGLAARVTEVPITALREGIALLDEWTDRLSTLDDGVIDSLAALGEPRPPVVQAMRERRARSRLNGLGYPCDEETTIVREFAEPSDALARAGVDDASRAAAEAALTAWSASALAALESARSGHRADCVTLIELERRDLERMRRAEAGGEEDPAAEEADDRDFELTEQLEARAAALRSSVARQMSFGRDVAEGALPEGMRPAFRSAWNALAVPQAFVDQTDALPALDLARGFADLTGSQRAQLDALRNEHVTRHEAACNMIAELTLARRERIDASAGTGQPPEIEPTVGATREISDLEFERRELDSRTLRRLRSALSPDQVGRVPQLRPVSRRRGATLIPAPTPAAPAPTSP